ncbi:hypothetical protein DYB31_000265 [Aphanomyces astaci]|uniref:DUF4455 domain-containing protein n=2 Tax=Aphanomyces astaci TaxID=112090 RepID=A0A397EX96_APHAT|nr:hypothetical protein DYB31_000265 [Aphanomyces astaci]
MEVEEDSYEAAPPAHEDNNTSKLDAKFEAEQALLAALKKPRDFHKKEAKAGVIKQLNISASDMLSYRQRHAATTDGSQDSVAVTEVRELHHQKVTTTTTTHQTNKVDKIAANAMRRRDRHTAAQSQYQLRLKAISDQLETDILRISDAIKEELAGVAAATANHFALLTDEPWLIQASHAMVVDQWTHLNELWSGRTCTIRHFGDGLEAIEQTRSALAGAELQLLTETCVAAAYVLPPEVERAIEDEAHELNVVLITNRRSHCHLVSRMLKEDVHKFVNVRTTWEDCERHWRVLNHDHAIHMFKATLESDLYTHPPRLHAILEKLRADQVAVHTNERLALLSQLDGLVTGGLSTEKVQRMVSALADMYKKEEERNAAYFDQLFTCQRDIVAEAAAMRELLRATCHRVGAKAKEGALATIATQLTTLLADKNLDEFFRISGGLRAELAAIEDRLASPDMIYQENVTALVPRVAMLVAALPMEAILDAQGKSSERKLIQATLERLRKAPKNEIVPLLPTLLAQTTILAGIQGIDDTLRLELDDIGRKLDSLIQDNEAQSSAAAAVKSKGIGLDAFQIADMQGIRKAQRRLGTLVYTTDLPPPFQALLHVILKALEVQTHANTVVDAIVALECNSLMAQREREMDALVAVVGSGLEAHTTTLHVTCDRVARFFYQLVACVENYEDKTRVVNLTVMDLLDTLKDTHDGNVAACEAEFAVKRSALRHAPDEATLEREFTGCLGLLEGLEDEYRKYNKKVSLASTNHPIAISRQNNAFQNELCAFFGLLSPSLGVSTAINDLLSAERIEAAIDSPPPSTPTSPPSTTSLHHHDPHDTAHDPPATSMKASPSTTTIAAMPTDASHASATALDHSHSRPDSRTTIVPGEGDVDVAAFCSQNGCRYKECESVTSILGRILQRKILLPGEEPSDDDAPPQDAEPPSPDPTPQSVEPPPPTTTKPTKGTPRGASAAVLQDHSPDVPSPDAASPVETPPEPVDEIHIPLESVIAVLDVPKSTLLSMLLRLRDATMTLFESRSAAHLDEANAEATARLDAYTFLLEECLRMHWPRKGRTDVQIYQPRAGELVSHRQRHGRHVKNVLKKLAVQEAGFVQLHDRALGCLRGQENAQLGLQSQLLMQTSLAALQGLESRSKKAHIEFKAAWGDLLRVKMAVYLTDEPLALIATCRELVTTCAHQIFPDLVSCDVISGCDYHPDEVKLVQVLVTEAETQIQAAVAARKATIDALEGQEGRVGALLVRCGPFLEKFLNLCLQNLSMKEGLGQKYGMPRRNAQERLRSEMTRSDNMASSIDDLLHVLTQAATTATVPPGPKGPSNVARHVRKVVLELRHLVYSRGLYLGVLTNKMQLAPQPVKDDMEASTKYDADAPVDAASAAVSKSFLDITKQFEVQCVADTRALFAAEGKPLDDHSIPDTLQAYLHEQHEKSVAYVRHQVAAYRAQVHAFEAALATAPRVAMEDIVRRAKSAVQSRVGAVEAAFQKQFLAWEGLKDQHRAKLTPDLCSPNQVAVVEGLCVKEATRTAAMQEAIRAVRWQVLVEYVVNARGFHRRLVAVFRAMMSILDTCTMTADIQPPAASGGAEGSNSHEDTEPTHKRKSLKRLRKALRKLEQGDPLAVELSEDERDALDEANETQRFPKRAWPGLPAVPAFDVAASIKQDTADGVVPPADPADVDTAVCVAYLTDAHRAAVKSRNETHAAYCGWLDETMDAMGRKYTTLLREEELWFLNWGKLTQSMRQDS